MSDVTAESAKLKWEPPEDDGGEPIDHYVVERMDTETGRWVPVTETKVRRFIFQMSIQYSFLLS